MSESQVIFEFKERVTMGYIETTIRVEAPDSEQDLMVEIENWRYVMSTNLPTAEARKMAFAILDTTGGREE